MITRSSRQLQPADWVDELRAAFTDPRALLAALDIDEDAVDLAPSAGNFPFRVPRPFVSRMRPRDPHDPLLMQVLPRRAELNETAGYGSDPVGDLASRRTSALLQKYRGRALMMLTGGCAINCRYCFRRHFPYAETSGAANLDCAIVAIENDISLTEVILSGGDPLLLKDDALHSLIERLARVGHLRRLRIHTRLPVTIPARMTERLLEILLRTRLQAVVVLHVNHPREIDAELSDTLRHCSRAGLQFLNQSVLLHGVNDDPGTLVELSECLFAASVLPYYVHLLDPVAGAAHFDVDEHRARAIAEALRTRLPGYLVPRFVREIAGAPAKTPIA